MIRITPSRRLQSFGFERGQLIADKYEIESKLGAGWEGEVYLTRECETGIERAAKFFFPHRNPHNNTVCKYAKKLHKLRNSGIMIHYHNHEKIEVDGHQVTCMISDFVEGELLNDYIARHTDGRLPLFKALHMLHGLASGMESIHRMGEYHGDLHAGNIFIQPRGIGFKLRLIDLYEWRDSKPQNIRFDVTNMIRIFYDSLGGQRTYHKQPRIVKDICRGLKSSLLHRQFRHAGMIRDYLDNLQWDCLE